MKWYHWLSGGIAIGLWIGLYLSFLVDKTKGIKIQIRRRK